MHFFEETKGSVNVKLYLPQVPHSPLKVKPATHYAGRLLVYFGSQLLVSSEDYLYVDEQ